VSSAFITTFSDKGYNTYAKQFLLSYKKNVDCPLFIVKSNDLKTKIVNEIKVDFPDVNIIENHYKDQISEFIEKYNSKIDKKISSVDKDQAYRYAPHRFIHKPAAMLTCLNELKSNNNLIKYLVWIDADSLILSKDFIISINDIKPGPNQIASVFDRFTVNYIMEAGLIVLNLNNKFSIEFISECYDIFISGKIFNMMEWHDAYIFSFIIHKYPPDSFRKLSSEFNLNSFHPIVTHPLTIGQIDHLKGQLNKKQKLSLEVSTAKYLSYFLKNKKLLSKYTNFIVNIIRRLKIIRF